MGPQGIELVLAGLVGLLTGLAAGVAFRFSEREQRPVEPAEPTSSGNGLAGGTGAVDSGVLSVLAALRSAAVVLDEDDQVVRATAAAHAYRLVRDRGVLPAQVQQMIVRARAEGMTVDEEVELPRGLAGSGTVALQVRVAPLGARHMLVLADDRTEARRLEATRRDFVVNVSHELKTPVGALTLLAETIQDAADDPQAVRKFALRMHTEAARLSKLVREIIELSRLQVADALAELRVVPVDDVVAEATSLTSNTANSKHIEIVVGGQRGCRVHGDRDLLVTAVRNLLDNAVSYSEPGTKIAVGVREGSGLVEVAVVDQGIGIAPEDQARVFERFYRVDPARSRDTGGTGLGLSIVKHIAADHGGEVTVWSRPGQGSTFTLRLPVVGEPTDAGTLLPRTPDTLQEAVS